MNSDEALKFVQNRLIAKNKNCLDDRESTIFKLSWDGHKYDEMEGVEEKLGKSRLNDAGTKLWKYLTEGLDSQIPIKKSNLIKIVETIKRQSGSEGESNKTNQSVNYKNADWKGAKEVLDENFYGRTEELQTLERWIVRDRLYIIFHMILLIK